MRSAWAGTATTSRAAKPSQRGTKNTTLIQNASEVASSAEETADNYVANGSGRAAAPIRTDSCTFAPVVGPAPTVPNSAQELRSHPPTTPYKANEWHRALKSADILSCFHLIPSGLRHGFVVDFPPITRVQSPHNKFSVATYTVEFNKTIQKELDKNRYIGPFSSDTLIALIGPFQSSPISIIPKPGKPGKFRLVQNFSYPLIPSPSFPSRSINSHVNPENFPTTWGKFSTVYLLISRLPPGAEAATRDVAEAYRTIPLHPSQWPATVIRASDDSFQIDTCLAFGATPAAGAYGLIADAGVEIFRWEGIGPLDKWVDDHIFLRVPKTHIVDYNELRAQWHLEIAASGLSKRSGGRLWFTGNEHAWGLTEEFNEDCVNPIRDLSTSSPRSEQDAKFSYCLDNVDRISARLGIPWEKAKDQPFGSSTIYIGFVWDLNARTVSLAPTKVAKYREAITQWRDRHSHVLKDVKQIYGKLLHASAALPRGRAYLTSLERMMKVCADKPFMPHRPIKAIANDLAWWDNQLSLGNVSRPITPPLPFVDPRAFSDASTGVGIAVTIGPRWRAWRLLPNWQTARGSSRDIGWAEAVGFELLIRTLNLAFPGLSRVIVYGDNTGVVEGWWAGRHRNSETNFVFRRIHSILSQTDSVTHVRTEYVRSELNPADGPSRGIFPSPHLLLPRIPIPPSLVPFIIDATDPISPAEEQPPPRSALRPVELKDSLLRTQNAAARWQAATQEEDELIRESLLGSL